MRDEPFRPQRLRVAAAFLDRDFATMEMRLSFVVVSAPELDRIRMRKDARMMSEAHWPRLLAGEALVAGVLFLTPDAALRRFATSDLQRALDERIDS